LSELAPARQIALHVANRYLGTPYRWGGDDPSGFDCSGLMVECLQSAGVFPRTGDATADGLRRMYPAVAAPEPGDLVLWLVDGRAVHVGMLWHHTDWYVGADGGGRSTQTADDAYRHNAYVMIRPVESRLLGGRLFATPYAGSPMGR